MAWPLPRRRVRLLLADRSRSRRRTRQPPSNASTKSTGRPWTTAGFRALAAVARRSAPDRRSAVGRDDFGDARRERGPDPWPPGPAPDAAELEVPSVGAGGGEADARECADHAPPVPPSGFGGDQRYRHKPERLFLPQHAPFRVLAEGDHGRRNGVGIDGRSPGSAPSAKPSSTRSRASAARASSASAPAQTRITAEELCEVYGSRRVNGRW